jgi:Flp pilus assembly protein TadB
MDSSVIILIVILAIAGVVAVNIYNRILADEERKDMVANTFNKRMESFEKANEYSKNEVANSMIEFVDEKLSDKFPWLGEKIIHSGLKIKAPVYLMMTIASIACAGIGSFFYLTLIQEANFTLSIVIACIIATLTGVGFYGFLEYSIGQRTTLFDEQFGVSLDIMAAAMQAGASFINAMKFVCNSMEPPVSSEFEVVTTELALGVELPTVLNRFYGRMASSNLFLFVIAIKVANATGAALAPTFSTLAQVITERFRLQGMVKIAIAENIASILFLAAAPWLIIPFLASSWPEAYNDFLLQGWAQILIGVLFAWYCFGIFLMYKAIKAIEA